MEQGRKNSAGHVAGNDNEIKNRNIMNRRNEQLDEELRSQLRKKNEESRKSLNDSSKPDTMDID